MPTSSISNTVKDGNGVAVPGVLVMVDLVPGPTFRITDGSEIAAIAPLVTDINGLWAAILEESSNLDPPGSYYRVREYLQKTDGGIKTYFFQVPAVDGLLHSNLVVPTVANSLFRPTIVTSGTHPASPFPGQMIFETDTGKVLFYYGTTLGWLPDWGVAWGEIAQTAVTSNQTTTGAVYVDAATASFTAIAGRRYLTHVEGQATLTGGATTPAVGYAITDGANAVLVEYKADLAQASFQLHAPMLHHGTGLETGAVSRKVRIKMATGTGTGGYLGSATGPLLLKIEDNGPAVAPVIT